jgi:DNA-binding NarL/FixJ family response regulator
MGIHRWSVAPELNDLVEIASRLEKCRQDIAVLAAAMSAQVEPSYCQSCPARSPMSVCQHPIHTVLTTREREVANYVRLGAGNLQIAGQLIVSVRTVEAFLTGIYRKLDVSDASAPRAILAAMAAKHADCGSEESFRNPPQIPAGADSNFETFVIRGAATTAAEFRQG